MVDNKMRPIEYLRISLTDRCNLKCSYCMPDGQVPCYEESHLLKAEEIIKVVRVSCGIGIRKVRLTGGEPLMRSDLASIIREINDIEAIEDVSITSNGVLLEAQVETLIAAGLKRINISLDTLDDQVYEDLTGRRLLGQVLRGIHKSLALGLKIKLNVVPIKGINDKEILALAMLAKDWGVDVRFIELMPIGNGKNFEGIETDVIIDRLKKAGLSLKPQERYRDRGPAQYYSYEGAQGSIGFISPMSHGFCGQCNRLRLTSEGFLKLCLHATTGIQLKPYLSSTRSDEALLSVLKAAIEAKPVAHKFNQEDDDEDQRMMYQIGG